METCRICGGDEQIVDLFNTDLVEKGQKLCFYILLSTGIHIKKEDIISKMVCQTCRETAVKFFEYRTNAVANDKVLQEENGQQYVRPIMDQELLRLGSQILLQDESFTTVAELSNSSASLDETCESANLIKADTEVNPQQSLNLQPGVIKHHSVQKLLIAQPNLILPQEVYHLDIAPVITLDKCEIEDWHKETFKRCQQKLSSLNISIRKVVQGNFPDKTTLTTTSPKFQESNLPHPAARNNTLPKQRLYKPCPKSRKAALVLKHAEPFTPDQLKKHSTLDTETISKEDCFGVTVESLRSNTGQSSKQSKRPSLHNTDGDIPTKKFKSLPPEIKPHTSVNNGTKDVSTQAMALFNEIDNTKCAASVNNIIKNVSSQVITPGSSSAKWYICELCKCTFIDKESLQKHKTETCFLKIINNQSVVDEQPVKIVVVEAKLDSKAETEIAENLPEHADVICISDSEDEPGPPEIDRSVYFKNLSENDAIQLLFDKYYYYVKGQNKFVQTSIPKKNIRYYATLHRVCIGNLYNDLLTYKIQVRFEAKRDIHVRYKYEHTVMPSKTIINWSNIQPITLKQPS